MENYLPRYQQNKQFNISTAIKIIQKFDNAPEILKELSEQLDWCEISEKTEGDRIAKENLKNILFLDLSDDDLCSMMTKNFIQSQFGYTDRDISISKFIAYNKNKSLKKLIDFYIDDLKTDSNFNYFSFSSTFKHYDYVKSLFSYIERNADNFNKEKIKNLCDNIKEFHGYFENIVQEILSKEEKQIQKMAKKGVYKEIDHLNHFVLFIDYIVDNKKIKKTDVKNLNYFFEDKNKDKNSLYSLKPDYDLLKFFNYFFSQDKEILKKYLDYLKENQPQELESYFSFLAKQIFGAKVQTNYIYSTEEKLAQGTKEFLEKKELFLDLFKEFAPQYIEEDTIKQLLKNIPENLKKDYSYRNALNFYLSNGFILKNHFSQYLSQEQEQNIDFYLRAVYLFFKCIETDSMSDSVFNLKFQKHYGYGFEDDINDIQIKNYLQQFNIQSNLIYGLEDLENFFQTFDKKEADKLKSEVHNLIRENKKYLTQHNIKDIFISLEENIEVVIEKSLLSQTISYNKDKPQTIHKI